MTLETLVSLSTATAAIVHLVASVDPASGQDRTDLLALAVEGYRASARHCFYADEVGAAIDEIDDKLARRDGSDWNRSKVDARSALGSARNFSLVFTPMTVPGNCVILGLAMSEGLTLASSLIGSNPGVASEATRLSNGGGRGRGEQAPDPLSPEATPTPDERAAREAAARERASIVDRAAVPSAVRAQIAPCWHPPAERAGVGKLRVTLRFHLNIDGSLRGEPIVVSPTDSPGFQAAARSAIRAVKRCGPLKLPPAVHAYWKEVELTFDPREMPTSK